MAIISANKSTHIAEAAKGYIGQIGLAKAFTEAIMNDGLLFEACLASDFTEARGLREGTILESETAKGIKAHATAFLDNVKKAWNSLWTKIKGIWNSFYTRLTRVIFMSNKAFLKANKAIIEQKLKGDFSGFKAKYKKRNEGAVDKIMTLSANLERDISAAVGKDFNARSMSEDELDSYISANKGKNIVEKTLGKLVGSDSLSSKEFSTAVDKKVFGDASKESNTFSAGEIKGMLDLVEKGDSYIAALKKARKDTDTAFKARLTEIEVAKKALQADHEASHVRKMISAVKMITDQAQSITKAVTGVQIGLIKKMVKSDRGVLAAFAGYKVGEVAAESAVTVKFYQEAAEDEVEDIIEDQDEDLEPVDGAPEDLDEVPDDGNITIYVDGDVTVEDDE